MRWRSASQPGLQGWPARRGLPKLSVLWVLLALSLLLGLLLGLLLLRLSVLLAKEAAPVLAPNR